MPSFTTLSTVDWNAAYIVADKANGKLLFTQRGCIACHISPDDGLGGAIGPSLVRAKDRFPSDYPAISSQNTGDRIPEPDF